MTDFTFLPAVLAEATGSGSPLGLLLPMGLLFVAMYFFMIAPQRKKEKELKKMLSELKNGDKVITIGGIFGTITAVKEDRFHVKIDESTRIEVLRSAIQSKQPSASEESK